MTHLCVADCGQPGRHTTDCADDGCRGCLPRLAADGSRLCTWHLGTLADDARALGELHAELASRLAGACGMGEKTSGTKDPGLALNDLALSMRTEIMHTLVSWTLLVCQERGVLEPNQDARSVAEFIVRNASWLAAHPAAAEVSSALHDLKRRAWGVAYPSGVRRFKIPEAQCPGREEPCGADLWTTLRPKDDEYISDWFCAGEPQHVFEAPEWLTIARRMRREAA